MPEAWRPVGGGGDYTFETCLHWLLGANPERGMHALWREVFDIDRLRFVHPEVFARLETEDGEFLDVYANVERMEAEFLQRAPQDVTEIRRFAAAVRRFTNFELPDPSEPWPRNWIALARTLPYLSHLRRWSNISCAEYGRRFSHPLLRSFFGEGGSAQLAALALVLMFAWLTERDAGYAIGGSQAIIALIADNLRNLGGRLRTGAPVEKILVERDTTVGVRLASGETIAADWVISAADGHATTDKLLDGRYRDATDRSLKPFPSYLQVSLGVARDLSQQPGYMIRVLDRPLAVDPGTELSQLAFRFFTSIGALRHPARPQSLVSSRPKIGRFGRSLGNAIRRAIRWKSSAWPMRWSLSWNAACPISVGRSR
jgi:phytoene dehydrogenase-like protein